MQPHIVSKKDGVDKAFNIKIETEFIDPEYVVNANQQELIGTTGLLKIFELESINNGKPCFRGRWDENPNVMDIDIYNTDDTTRLAFLGREEGYEGHRPDLIDKNNRTFKVSISILGEAVYKGLVSFGVNHTAHLEAGRYRVTGGVATFKVIRGPKHEKL